VLLKEPLLKLVEIHPQGRPNSGSSTSRLRSSISVDCDSSGVNGRGDGGDVIGASDAILGGEDAWDTAVPMYQRKRQPRRLWR